MEPLFRQWILENDVLVGIENDHTLADEIERGMKRPRREGRRTVIEGKIHAHGMT
jgi:hypothetical protein